MPKSLGAKDLYSRANKLSERIIYYVQDPRGNLAAYTKIKHADGIQLAKTMLDECKLFNEDDARNYSLACRASAKVIGFLKRLKCANLECKDKEGDYLQIGIKDSEIKDIANLMKSFSSPINHDLVKYGEFYSYYLSGDLYSIELSESIAACAAALNEPKGLERFEFFLKTFEDRKESEKQKPFFTENDMNNLSAAMLNLIIFLKQRNKFKPQDQQVDVDNATIEILMDRLLSLGVNPALKNKHYNKSVLDKLSSSSLSKEVASLSSLSKEVAPLSSLSKEVSSLTLRLADYQQNIIKSTADVFENEYKKDLSTTALYVRANIPDRSKTNDDQQWLRLLLEHANKRPDSRTYNIFIKLGWFEEKNKPYRKELYIPGTGLGSMVCYAPSIDLGTNEDIELSERSTYGFAKKTTVQLFTG